MIPPLFFLLTINRYHYDSNLVSIHLETILGLARSFVKVKLVAKLYFSPVSFFRVHSFCNVENSVILLLGTSNLFFLLVYITYKVAHLVTEFSYLTLKIKKMS